MEYLQNITPRDYQLKILETCIEKNTLVVLPTGLGKTLIAIMLTIDRMKKFPGQKVILLAPTKPLAEQHLASFQKYLPELFADMQLFTGKINSIKRKEIFRTADIIFSTPQCIANDLKKEYYKLDEVCLLVEDEAHRCVKNYDYNNVAKRYKMQNNESFKILGLTASPGSDKEQIRTICKNLSINGLELRTRESADVKKYLEKREFEKIETTLPVEFLEIRHVLTKLYDSYVAELKFRRVLFGPATKIRLIKLQQEMMGLLKRGNKNFNHMLAVSACASAIKVSHAIELVETQTLFGLDTYLKKLSGEARDRKSKGVVKLVAKPEFIYAHEKTNELIIKGREHPKIAELEMIINKEIKANPSFKAIIFSQFRDTAKVIAEKLNIIDNITAKAFVGQAKKAGSGLTQKEQKKIIQEFSSGDMNILCATCIAEEGLDIPEVNAVVFYEPIPSAIRTIQRAGRTARLSKGKLIILITKDTRDETYYYVSKAREKSMSSAIESIQKNMTPNKNESIPPEKLGIKDMAQTEL